MKKISENLKILVLTGLLGQMAFGVIAQPAVPVANDVSRCGTGSVTLTATCATPGATIYWLYNGMGVTIGPTYTTVSFSSSKTFQVISKLDGVFSQGMDNVTAIIVNNIPSANAGSDQTICNGQSVALGIAPLSDFTYSWSPATGLSSSTVANPTASPSSNTTYTLTVTSCSGATATDQVTVTVKPLPATPVANDVSRCGPGSVTLTVSSTPGADLFWILNGSGVGTGTVYTTPSLTSNATYTIGAMLYGCANPVTDVATAIINPIAVADAGSDHVICDGGSRSIGVGPTTGYVYSWSPSAGLSATNISNPIANPGTPTTYTLTVTAPGGCTATDQVTVNYCPAVPVANDVSRCGEGSVTFTATCATPGATIHWLYNGMGITTGATYTTVSLNSNKTFQVVAALNGVFSQGADNVTATILNNVPSANAGSDQTICNGQSVALGIAPLSDFTYSWSPATGLNSSTVSNPTASPSSTTTYTLTVTSCSGATATDQVTVNVKPLPATPVANDVSRCGPGSVTLTVTSTPGADLFWILNGSGAGTGTAYTTPSLDSDATYTIGAMLNGCANPVTDVATAIIKPLPIANAGVDKLIWSGMTTTFGASPTVGYTYSWLPTTGLSSASVADPTFSHTGDFLDTYYKITANLDGCTAVDFVRVAVLPQPVVTVTDFCGYTRLTYTPEPTEQFKGYWQTIPDGTSTENSSSPRDITTPGTYYIRGMFNGNWSPNTVTVNVPSIKQIAEAPALGPDIGIENGQGVSIGVSPIAGYTYSWNPYTGLNAGNISNPVASPTSTTTYTLTATNPDGCSASSTKTVTVSSGGSHLPQIIATYYPTYIRLTYSESPPAGILLFWQTASTNTSLSNGLPYWDIAPCPGTYYLRAASTVLGAWSPYYSSITIKEGADAGPDLTICAGDRVPIGDEPRVGYTYSWSASPSSSMSALSAANIPNPVANPTVTTTYTLETTSSCGVFTDQVTITIIIDPVLTTFGPTASENYVMVTTMNVPGSNPVNSGDAARTITYYDGLGRPKQIIAALNSPSQLDVIQPIVYDEFGRESLKYLPYTSGTHGGFRQNIIEPNTKAYTCTAGSFYAINSDNKIADDDKPYAETIFEPSPLNRVFKQGAPGVTWQPNANATDYSEKTVKREYALNAATEVLLWAYDPATHLVSAKIEGNLKYYSSNELFVSKTYDEHNNLAIEYKDKEGKVVLKRVQTTTGQSPVNDANFASTYYIYDDFGNLVTVIQPEGVSKLGALYHNATALLQETFLARWAFRYKYDESKHMIEKWTPGADRPMFMVYDNRDRLVLTQDGNLRKNTAGTDLKKWIFTKYDHLNRPVSTGIYTADSVLSQELMQKRIERYYDELATNNGFWFESFSAATGNVHGYDNKSFPVITDPLQYLTLTYYDDYSYKTLLSDSSAYMFKPDELDGQKTGYSKLLKGQITGTKVKVIDGEAALIPAWLNAVHYFDVEYRPIQVLSDNVLGGIDRATSIFDFTSKVLKTKTTHYATWKDIVGISVAGKKITKTLASTSWNAGAASIEKLPAGQDGWLEVTVSEITTNRMIGLSDVNVDANYNSIDYALYIASGQFRIYEGGTLKLTLSGAATNQVLRIERIGDIIKYLRNGVIVYTSTIPSTTDLIVDCSLSDAGATLSNIRTSFTGNAKTITRTFEYDPAGRLLKTWHQVDQQSPVLLAYNTYNELGQLIDKKLHSSTSNASDTRQSADYRYNIRGWLTSMNNSSLAIQSGINDDSGDLFGYELGYNQDLGIGNEPLFNGNISGIKWSNFAATTTKEKGYIYSYDPLNRIASASYKEKSSDWGSAINSGFSESGYSYDLNGNIKTLTRYDQRGSVTPLDILNYNYGAVQSNRLMNVTDTGDKHKGFMDGTNGGDDYVYDNNGNMITDNNKLINITYNHLNLPYTITKGSSSLKYFYDATGRKVLQTVGLPNIKYHLKDHLGNVRVTFTTKDEIENDKATLETEIRSAGTVEVSESCRGSDCKS
jgi:hypothetical protein